jgi:hypothetical protein
MKWLTRERPKIDRIACPWLAARFIGKAPEFLHVPAHDVVRIVQEQGAIAYDIPGVELSHAGDLCRFHAFLAKYGLSDPALYQLAVIVRGGRTRHAWSLRRGWRGLTRCIPGAGMAREKRMRGRRKMPPV